MPPPKLYTQPLPARFAPGTRERIERVISSDETLAAFVRAAVNRELLNREAELCERQEMDR